MKKLYLSEDKKISGLCGGIAEYLDIDASVVRLAWLLITVLTGIVPGVLAYVVGVIVVPKAPNTESKATP